MNGFIGTNFGDGGATFIVTGGTLASYFGGSGGTGGLVNLNFNISPFFSSGTFNSDFNGSVKGDLAPAVPIPSSLLLMGTGLAALLAMGTPRAYQF